LQSLRGLTTALTVMLGAMALVNVANLLANVQLRSRWLEVTGDGQITGSLADLYDVSRLEDRANGLTVLGAVGALATGIVFIIWLFKARSNIEPLGERGGLATGWAIGGWFIPCASWVLPFLVARDTWLGSRPRARTVTLTPLAVWWGTWVVGGIATMMQRFTEPDDAFVYTESAIASLVDDYSQARLYSIIGATSWAASAVFAIIVVRSLDRMQQERVVEIRAGFESGSVTPGW
jgi:hypothetical protein